MQAVILAGGAGNRLHPLTTSVPKPMMPLFDRPVMEHTVRLLAKHGIEDIIIAVSSQAADIMQYFGDGSRFGVSMRYSVETQPRGTAGALKSIQGMIDGAFVVVSGDAITDADLTSLLHRHKAASATATLMLHRVSDPTEFGVAECDSTGRITRFAEKPKSDDAFADTVSAGIYIFEPEVLSCIPYDRAFDISRELLPSMLNNQENIHGFDLPSYWCDAGHHLDYVNAHSDAMQGLLKIAIPATNVGGDVWIGDGVELHGSVELGASVYIGAGAVVGRNAVIGDRTVIGAGTVVEEGARVARSLIGGGSLIARESDLRDCFVSSGYSSSECEIVHGRINVSSVYYTPAAEHVPEAKPQKTETRTPQQPTKAKVIAG